MRRIYAALRHFLLPRCPDEAPRGFNGAVRKSATPGAYCNSGGSTVSRQRLQFRFQLTGGSVPAAACHQRSQRDQNFKHSFGREVGIPVVIRLHDGNAHDHRYHGRPFQSALQ